VNHVTTEQAQDASGVLCRPDDISCRAMSDHRASPRHVKARQPV
jgi:hypothetical protein